MRARRLRSVGGGGGDREGCGLGEAVLEASEEEHGFGGGGGGDGGDSVDFAKKTRQSLKVFTM